MKLNSVKISAHQRTRAAEAPTNSVSHSCGYGKSHQQRGSVADDGCSEWSSRTINSPTLEYVKRWTGKYGVSVMATFLRI